MPDVRADARPALVLAATVLLAGCVATTWPPADSASDLDVHRTLALMERARVARGDTWLGLHNHLTGAVVLDGDPAARARLALALSVGERTPGDLQRAGEILDAILDPSRTPRSAFSPSMLNLLRMHRDALRARREATMRVAELEAEAASREEELVHEAAMRARVSAERDQARAALAEARERLRELTRIELEIEARGG